MRQGSEASSLPPVVVLVTDPRFSLERTREVIRSSAAALGPGRLLVQLRDKERGTHEALLSVAHALREVTLEVGARFVVNGPLSVARAARADGLHVAGALAHDLVAMAAEARDALGANAFVSAPAHDDDDVRRASEAGLTAALVSPIFSTPGKGAARGLAALTAARAIVDAMRRVPPLLLYALGGVTAADAEGCARAGADGVAAIRSLFDAPMASAAARALAAPFARLPVAVGRDEC